MSNKTDRVYLMQTATNAAAGMTAAEVTAGIIGESDDIVERFKNLRDEAFAGLVQELVAVEVERASRPVANPDNPGEFILTGGKHKGTSLGDLYIENPGYVDWLTTNKNPNEFSRKAAKRFLESIETSA